MAEGGCLTSFTEGSGANFDIVCTPCGEDNIREEAVKYCPECQEHLCTTCTRHHGRLKATRSHELQASYTAKQSLRVTMTTKCLIHPDCNIEMYCETHDMVYCTTCIAKEHRSCNDVTYVDDIKLSLITSRELQRVQTDMDNCKDRLEDIDETTQKNIASLEKQREEILEEIEKVERKLIEHIQKLKYEAVNNLKKEYLKVKNELESTATVVDGTRNEIEKSSKMIQTLPNMDARQQFIQSKLIQNALNDTRKLLAESEVNGSKKLCLTENSKLKTSVITSTSLGHVHTLIERKQQIAQTLYKVKSKKEINVKINDQKTCNITDVCQLPDGTNILTDCNNEKIKRLDKNYNIRDHCDLDACPTGICYTGQNKVAVKMSNNKVQFISVGRSLSKLRQISIVGGVYWGMTYIAGELWIPNGNGVNVYSTSGTLVKTVSNDINGQKVFKLFPQRLAVSGETVIVTDTGDGAVCLGRDGTVRGNVRDVKLTYTQGVCASANGTIFLSGVLSNNIVMFDKNRKRLGEVLGEHDGLVKPASLCYDDKRKCLIVTMHWSNKILIFNF